MTMIVQLPHPELKLAAVRDDLPRVLLVLDQFPKTLGGGERIVLRLAALMRDYGYEPAILTFSIHPESVVLRTPQPCPIFLLPLQRTYDLTAMRAALELANFLRQRRIAIVQTFFESSDIWAGFVTKNMSDAKLIWSRRDMGILRTRKHHFAYRLMAESPDAVFAVSEQVRQHCIDVDGIDAGRVLTIYNGLNLGDWDKLNPRRKGAGEIVIASVGNVRRVKGHDLLIKSAASIVPMHPEVSIQIAGEVLEQDYFDELQEMIRDHNLVDHFHFVGGVASPREFLADADIFVLPSRSEGFSNAIVEAMASALPVVATDVGGNAEAVENGKSGFIVPSEDVGALTAALQRLLSDPAESRALGVEGKRLAGAQFTTEAMMEKITQTYARLLFGV